MHRNYILKFKTDSLTCINLKSLLVKPLNTYILHVNIPPALNKFNFENDNIFFINFFNIKYLINRKPNYKETNVIINIIIINYILTIYNN